MKKVKSFFFSILFLYAKMTSNYYKKNKEELLKKAREKYQDLSEEEKDKNCQYARERYRNHSEEEKEKKGQYGRERYKNLLEDEYRKLFLEC